MADMNEAERIEKARKVAEVTTARVKQFEELNAPSEKEGHEVFLKKTRELWKEFTTHEVFQTNAEGKSVLLNYPDFDGKVALELFKKAGFNTKNVNYVPAGTSVPGRIMIDTGNEEEFTVKDKGKTAVFDHHKGKKSATQEVYEALVAAGLLTSKDGLYGLEQLAKFITEVDNNTNPQGAEQYLKSYRTMRG